MSRIRVPVVVALAFLAAATGPALARDATPIVPPGAPDASECRVEPRPIEDVEALVGTPVVEATPPTVPEGVPADDATIAAVEAAVREYYACSNAGEGLRLLGLFSDAGFLRFVGRVGAPTEADVAALRTSFPVPAEERYLPRTVRDIEVLPDGRARAIVVESIVEAEATGEIEEHLHEAEAKGEIEESLHGEYVFIFVEGVGRYLIDDLFYVPPRNGTPIP